jgi:hypothetical protein
VPIDVHVEIVIARPRAVVAAYMFDPANDAAWTTGVVECRPLVPGRLRPGSAVERLVRFAGRRFWYRYDVIAAEGDRFVEMNVEKPFPMRVRYELEDEGAGTRATIRASGDPGGFFRFAGPLLAPMVRRNIGKDLELLKARVEV